MSAPAIKTVQLPAPDDPVPMHVCWRMFDLLFRRAVCALGDVNMSAAYADWDDLSGKDRAVILAVLHSMAGRR